MVDDAVRYGLTNVVSCSWKGVGGGAGRSVGGAGGGGEGHAALVGICAVVSCAVRRHQSMLELVDSCSPPLPKTASAASSADLRRRRKKRWSGGVANRSL